VWSVCRYRNVHISVCGLSLLNCNIFVFSRSACTVLNILRCVFCLSVLNCTHCCLWSLCRYLPVHTAVCGLSVCTEQDILLCVISLLGLNCTHCYVSYVRRERTIHIGMRLLSVGNLLYKLLCVLSMSKLYYTDICLWSVCLNGLEHIAGCGLSLNTDLYTSFF